MITSYIPIIAASALGYHCFNFLCNYGFILTPPPGKYAGKERHRWHNAVTSLLNAVIASGLVIYCLYSQPGLWSEPLTHYAECVGVCFAVLSGYLIYDTYDLLTNYRLIKVWALIVHHVISTFTLFLMSIERLGMGLLTIGMLSEVSAIFLHSRQLLLMHGLSKRTTFYGVHRLFNFVTFILLRMTPLVYATYCAFTTPQESYYLGALVPCVPGVVTVINFALLWRLICSDLLPNGGKDRHAMDN